MELHERIAFVRKAAGLTQEQLGEKLGVTRQAVSKWESNQATPDAVTVARLCAELHVSADFVLLGINRDEPLEKVVSFGKQTGITYPLALDPGADVFAKYALRKAGITRNVLIDRNGRIVMLTRLYNPEEFASLVKKINEMLK